MKNSRSWLIWATLATCAILVIGAMALLTRNVRATQLDRAKAEARANLEEQTRLALWRMDAAGAAILLQENQRPPADYDPNNTQPSLPMANDPLVKLHFEVRNGTLQSPEGKQSKHSLEQLRQLLAINGSIPTLLNSAAIASENAWNNLKKDNDEVKQELTSNPKEVSKGKNPSRYDSDYQVNFNRQEKAQRTKVLQSQEIASNGINAYANNALTQQAVLPEPEATDNQRGGPAEQVDALANQTLAPANAPGPFTSSSASGLTEISNMRPVWIGDELLLLRQLKVSNALVFQGLWLDAAALRQRLLAEIPDLLPDARLLTCDDKANDPLALVSFPFRLERNQTSLPATERLSKPLLVGWAAVICALIAVAALVQGVMQLSERRASFVSAVTHELRTPLTTFKLYSDMLESGAVKEEKRGSYLQILSREADRLSHLVENVLAFSRIERGNARSQVREIETGLLLEENRERLEARLNTAGLGLSVDSTSTLRVRADTTAVEHILFNLIDNAAKYAANSEPPMVRIDVRKSGRFAEILVTDHGPGIPLSERSRIFHPFHKSAHEAAETKPGVGLGLALSRRLAKAQGGDLLCNGSGRGAEFILRLPLARA